MTEQSLQRSHSGRPRSDFRDLCLDEAIARIADLEHDIVSYRGLLQQTLAIVVERNRELKREEIKYLAVLAEFRAFREQMMVMASSVTDDRPRRPKAPVVSRSQVPIQTAESQDEKRPYA